VFVLALPLAAQAPPLFVEVAVAPARVFVQQPVELAVRIGVDSAWFAASGVPLFQQRLDQPFHVAVPWLGIYDGSVATALPPPIGAPTQRIAVGDQVLAVRRVSTERRGERAYDVLELRCRWLSLAAGHRALAPVEVRYAFATRFEEDFLRGRQAVDRQDASVSSAPCTVDVMSLPGEAPAGFTGAVGAFTVRARSASASVAVGESFVLALEVRGDGNLERFSVPPLPRLAGFHVQGVVDRPQADVRRFEFDVVALRAGVGAVPAVPFVAFAPARAAFETLASEPVPIEVRPASGELPERVRELVAADAAAVAAANAPSTWWAVLAAAVAGAALTFLQRRRRASRRSLAVARAAVAFAAVPARDAGARFAAFEALLAAAIGEPAWSAVAWSQLAACGVGGEALASLRALHAALDAARFGGAPPGDAAGAAGVDALRGRRA
jgi:hypothetical protein